MHKSMREREREREREKHTFSRDEWQTNTNVGRIGRCTGSVRTTPTMRNAVISLQQIADERERERERDGKMFVRHHLRSSKVTIKVNFLNLCERGVRETGKRKHKWQVRGWHSFQVQTLWRPVLTFSTIVAALSLSLSLPRRVFICVWVVFVHKNSRLETRESACTSEPVL